MAPFHLLRMCLHVGQRDRFIFMLAASFEFQQCLIYSFHTSMFYSAVCLLRCTCIMSVDEGKEGERERGERERARETCLRNNLIIWEPELSALMARSKGVFPLSSRRFTSACRYFGSS